MIGGELVLGMGTLNGFVAVSLILLAGMLVVEAGRALLRQRPLTTSGR